MWSYQYGSIGVDLPTRITTDSSGDIYVTVSTYGLLVWSNANIVGGPNIEDSQSLLKFSSTGELQWEKQLPSSPNSIQKIFIDSTDNIYLVDTRREPTIESCGEYNVEQAYLLKIDKNGLEKGEYISPRKMATSLAIDTNDNVYYSGMAWDAYCDEDKTGNVGQFISRLD